MGRLAPALGLLVVALVVVLTLRGPAARDGPGPRAGEGPPVGAPGAGRSGAPGAGGVADPDGRPPAHTEGGSPGVASGGDGRDAGRAGSGQGAEADRGPEITVERRRYAVSGTTARQLRRSLREEGRRMEGRTAFAWTDWSVDVGYEFRRSGEECRIVRPDVEVRIVVTLPEWRDRGGAALDLVSRWRRDLAAMEEHEQGHVRLARRAGRRVYRALEELGPAPCAVLRDRADAAADAVLREERRAQDRYDQRTDFGRRQDAARLRP